MQTACGLTSLHLAPRSPPTAVRLLGSWSLGVYFSHCEAWKFLSLQFSSEWIKTQT